jgi:hypothetical protein
MEYIFLHFKNGIFRADVCADFTNKNPALGEMAFILHKVSTAK